MATVKTALGEILPNQMGITLSHEHIILTYPSAKSDRPDRYNVETLADQVVEHLGPTVRDYGLKTMIDATPWQLGRDVELQQLVSQRLNINVIVSTGFYRQEAAALKFDEGLVKPASVSMR